MSKSLVIVESPAKAKTISKYLGGEYVVKSSVGHIRDLPTSGRRTKGDPAQRTRERAKTKTMDPATKAAYKKKQAHKTLIKRMGINPDLGWAADYEILPDKVKVVEGLRAASNSANYIYLATDLDREGEAIAWHLREVIGGDDNRYRRVVFNEITEKAIREAFQHPSSLNNHKVEAQQTRRFLDRVVGFMISPLLWAKIARGLSAGRVQSVAVRLLIEREREIRVFTPEEYWEIYVDTLWGKEKLQLQVIKHGEKNFRPASKSETDQALEILSMNSYEITKRKDRPTSSKPNPPLITSTLQQAASTRLGFSVKRTMRLAQQLYESGHITYMRTDSTNLSSDAVADCRNYVLDKYGSKYLPEKAIFYTSIETAQEAHEAIRPTNVGVASSTVASDRDQQLVYELIHSYFVACQMSNARYLSTAIAARSGEFELRAKGRIVEFDGYTRVLPSTSKQEDIELPDVKIGDSLTLDALTPKQNFTKPRARYTEASLVKELEKRGIGRPSTYASIISTIQDRGYVTIKNRRFFAEKIGEIVTDRLTESFSNLMDYGFTAEMEETLDQIAKGNKSWQAVLDSFYGEFREQLDTAANGGMRSNEPTSTDIACPQCERHMQIRNGATGVFLGCSGYSLPKKERCTQTINLIDSEEIAANVSDEDSEIRELVTMRRCSVCKTAMESYLIDEGRKMHICGDNPDCSGYEIEFGVFKIKGYDGATLECDKCSSEMQLRSGRFGKYFKCTNDDCTNTRKLLKSGEAAPPRADPIEMPNLRCEKVDDYYLLRDGASGIFLAASQFPKNRETRAPFVDEILDVKDQLDPKYRFLTSAPVKDSDGNRTQVRFSRKMQQQYVLTEVDKKPTGWKAFFRDGSWQVEDRVRSIPRKKKKNTHNKDATLDHPSKRKKATKRKASSSAKHVKM
ncbi:MAG: DNA topoisomerase I subunit omega [Acidiferrobacteraceae bacterium]|nr:DNA topoisomerase I subunit omega [Acidiferrobacteraceae bacterium]